MYFIEVQNIYEKIRKSYQDKFTLINSYSNKIFKAYIAVSKNSFYFFFIFLKKKDLKK